MSETPGALCAYEPCLCSRPYSKQNLATGTKPVDPDAAYCSERCRTLDASQRKVACECGHPECAPRATNDIPPMM